MRSLTITKREIAQLGGPSVDALSRAAMRERLEEAGFPRPLPGFERPLRWSRIAVEAFLNGSSTELDVEPGDLEAEVEELTRRLAERSRAVAARER